MNENKKVEFALKNFPGFSPRVIRSYNHLPVDGFLKPGEIFRERRFSRVKFKDGIPEVLNQDEFFQDESLNSYAGGLHRKFELVDDSVCSEFCVVYINNVCPLVGGLNAEVGFHQLRITCSDKYVGYPTPEGWHRDGFDYVSIICVSASNICGGVSRIREELDSANAYFTKIMLPSEIIILNDKRFYHCTDPIKILDKGKIGYRDILVMTISV